MRSLSPDQLGLVCAPPEGRFRWRLLVEEVHVGGFCCESYGVAGSDSVTGQEFEQRHVTVNGEEAAALLALLVRGDVSPLSLNDVIEDWLGR